MRWIHFFNRNEWRAEQREEGNATSFPLSLSISMILSLLKAHSQASPFITPPSLSPPPLPSHPHLHPTSHRFQFNPPQYTNQYRNPPNPADSTLRTHFEVKFVLCLSLIANPNGRSTATTPRGAAAASNELHDDVPDLLFDQKLHEFVHGPETARKPCFRN